jgi:L-threonylcarbamoyladenylate synthase
VEQIEPILGKVLIKTSNTNPIAPGMLKHHYAPDKIVIIGNISELVEQYGTEEAGILSFKDHFERVSDSHQIQLSPSGDLNQAAQNLFAALRKLDGMNIRYIFAELVPDCGLGVAINNRLVRASSM